jgi:hypothetical protein
MTTLTETEAQLASAISAEATKLILRRVIEADGGRDMYCEVVVMLVRAVMRAESAEDDSLVPDMLAEIARASERLN